MAVASRITAQPASTSWASTWVIQRRSSRMNRSISSTAQATYAVDANVRTTAASIDTTAAASLTEDIILGILQSIATTKRSSQTVTAFVGPSLKRAVNNFPMFIPSSTYGTAASNGGAYPTPLRGGLLDRVIDRYNTDFCLMDMIISYNNYALGTTSSLKNSSALMLHQDMWEIAWGDKPNWVQKAYEGGKMEAFCEAIWMLTCWSPAAEGKYAPAS